MDSQEITQFISDNHRLFILIGGAICFIALFLPFGEGTHYYESVSVSGIEVSISETAMFWLYLIALAGLFYGYFQGYGERYPFIFLAIGGFLVLLTILEAMDYSKGYDGINLLYGAFLEFIGSLGVTAGGYYYYELNKTAS